MKRVVFLLTAALVVAFVVLCVDIYVARITPVPPQGKTLVRAGPFHIPGGKPTFVHCTKDYCYGTRGEDLMLGSAGKNNIDGGLGNDVIRALAGNDTLSASRIGFSPDSPESSRDRFYGGRGSDLISSDDGARDRVNCGPGKDLVYFDENLDAISKDCERRQTW